jgi:hypothetical protein
MYKEDIREALKRLRLTPGGAVASLLAQAQPAAEIRDSAVAEIAANNDASVKVGRERMQAAVRTLLKRISELSPSGTVIELHQLGGKFDAVLLDYPLLDPLLRPGRQALASLAGAYDVVMQQNKTPPAVAGLIAPSVELATCYSYYSGLEQTLNASKDESVARDSLSIVEVSGAERLEALASYLGLLALLGEAAASCLRETEPETSEDLDLNVFAIESGSPVQITLTGSARTMRLMLTMLRDVVRVPYQHLTAHGRVVQTIETLALAKTLGVDTPEGLAHLEDAMVKAARLYSENLDDRVALKIDGRPIARKSGDALRLTNAESDRRSLPPARDVQSGTDEE